MYAKSTLALLIILVSTTAQSSLDRNPILDINEIPLVQSAAPTKPAKNGLTTLGSRFVDFVAANYSSALVLESVRSGVITELSRPELAKYFPTAASRVSVAIAIESQMKDELKGVATSATLNAIRAKATRLTTENILATVFTTEKIGDTQRAKMWADKITAPVTACITTRNSAAQGERCSEKAARDLEANMALAVSFETSRKHLDPAIARHNVSTFHACIAKPKAKSADCGLESVRAGTEAHLFKKYKERQEQQLPGHSDDLSAPHRAAVQECINKATTTEQFHGCGDLLTERAGQDIARVKAMTNPAVTENVPDSFLPAVGRAAEAAFKTCIQENKGQGEAGRDNDGTLKTSNCEGRVRKAIGHEMRSPILEEQLAKEKTKDIGLTPDAVQSQRDAISAGHRRCVDKLPETGGSDRDLLKCFQDSGREIADFLGNAKFKTILDDRMKDKSPAERLEYHKNLMAEYRVCLKAAQNKDALEGCAVKSAQNLTSQLGKLKYRSTLEAAIGKTGMDQDSAEIARIEKEFLACVESKTNLETIQKDLEECSQALRAGGTDLVKKKAAAFFIEKGDSAQVVALKNDIIGGLDSLSRLTPAGGPKTGSEKVGSLEPALKRLNEVIKYNPAAADKSLREVLKEAKRVGATPASMSDTMIKSGTLDQMIKASAFKKIVGKMNALKDEERPSEKVLAILTSKANFDKIFTPEVMARLRAKLPGEITALTTSGATPAQLARIHKEVAETLANSPRFGRLYAKDIIEAKIKKQVGFDLKLPNSRLSRRTIDRFVDHLLRPTLINGRLTDSQRKYGESMVERYATAAVMGQKDSDLPEERPHLRREGRHIANEADEHRRAAEMGLR